MSGQGGSVDRHIRSRVDIHDESKRLKAVHQGSCQHLVNCYASLWAVANDGGTKICSASCRQRKMGFRVRGQMVISRSIGQSLIQKMFLQLTEVLWSVFAWVHTKTLHVACAGNSSSIRHVELG